MIKEKLNFTAHRMNTGLRGIFNGFSVEIFLKNDSSPQITNLARINTGIAEMLFRRTLTPKGIETNLSSSYALTIVFRRTLTPKGIETTSPKEIATGFCLEGH